MQQVDGFGDISFNFLVSDFGLFECRGWDLRPQRETIFQSDDFLHIRVLSRNVSSMYELFPILDRLLADGAVLGKVSSDIKVFLKYGESSYVTRDEWEADETINRSELLSTPITRIIFTQTGDASSSCTTLVNLSVILKP